MDGWVTIGTKLDSKQLEKDLKDAEKRLQQYEREAERLTKQKAKTELNLEDYYKQKELIKESTDSALKYAQTESEVNHTLELEKSNLQQLSEAYSKQLNAVEEINKKIQENTHNQGLLNEEIKQMNIQLDKAKGFGNLKSGIDGIGKSVEKVTKKISRWALAIFGIRSAYMFVRQAMSTLSEYNDDLANKISNIRLVLATALEPVINRIISLVITLLNYLNYLTTAWFGLNIFARASELSSKKMADNLGSGAKSAKEIKKQLASFDEMNVLQDNTSAGGGGSGAGTTTPEFNMPEVEIPEWLKWIANNKDIVIAALIGIATAIGLINLGVGIFMSLGIGLIITGIILLVQDIIKFIKDPSWDNFVNILRDLAIVLAGVAIAMLAVNAANPVAWVILAIAAIVALVAVIIKYWDQIKAWLLGLGKWINDHVIQPIAKFFKGLWDAIVNGVKTAFNNIKNVFNGIVNFFKGIINTIIGFFKNVGATVGSVISSAFKGVVNGVLRAIENILNAPIRAINGLIGVINKIPGINLGRLSTFSLPRLAKGGIINMPGKGVPVGGAIAGERGQEAVLPLTDSQQMELLGEAIGKYITINATMINQMNGRVISRELQKVQNQSNFAMNR